ncbi:MAG: MBL fold metallo-hydrolase [Deltaproteobacteria bacterium]|nr:MBL fold metallo-hydrolase [Deltaproteobacteria bacterium]
MRRLIVLGTGYALATRCYNTCFVLEEEEGCFLVDAGGGNGILTRLDEAGIPLTRVREAFVSHSYSDHILGMVWVVRKIATLIGRGQYDGIFTIHCHAELAAKLRTILELTFVASALGHLDAGIVINTVADGETRPILGRDTTFFDIRSTKEKQFGFTTALADEKKLTFLGDEPYNERCEAFVNGSDWLLSEAFCLYSQRERFKPYEKHHSTVRDACKLAARMGVENLVLWHTEDENIRARKALYTAEGRDYFQGNLFVPDDGDVILL